MSSEQVEDTENESKKRQRDVEGDLSDDADFGPAPPSAKRRKTLKYHKLYMSQLPSAEKYEKSFMHRDCITHIAVTKTNYIITASCDGHVKFWIKQPVGIEFVKHFRSHLGMFVGCGVSILLANCSLP